MGNCCVCGADDFADDWQRWDDHPARRQWEVLKDLGAGAGSQVVLARHRASGELAALKVVFLECPTFAGDEEHLATLQRESDLLALLDHPHIVECRDVLRSPRQLVLVLEWLRGGQVIDRLHELGLQYSEQQAAAIFVQVAAAVAHLHEYRILHRDIKPENVMFASPPAEAAVAPLTAAQLQAGGGGGGARGAKGPPPSRMPLVKLVDLGMACIHDPARPQRGPLGSPGFVAPEVVADGVHTPAMDVFSLGVLLFIMLVGRKPFNIRESESLRYALLPLQSAPGLKDPRWLDLSPDAKHLVMGMLAYDPARRLTMQQVLQHEWVVSRGGILPRPLGQDVVYGAATVASIRRLRNLCGGVVAFNRAAAAASSTGASSRGGGGGGIKGDSAKDAYLRRLKQSQRLELSSRGGSVVARVAAGLAGSAYAKAHDAGGSVHPADDPSASFRRGARAAAAGDASADASQRSGRRLAAALPWRRRAGQGSQASLQGGSLHGQAGDPSASRRARFTSQLPGGLTRAGTTVLLSEMDRAGWSPSLSRKGSGVGSAGGSKHALRGRSLASFNAGAGEDGGVAEAWAAAAAAQPALQRRPSALQLLSAAAKAYLDSSTHGGSRRGAGASAALAAAQGSGGALRGDDHSTRSVRQVADDSVRSAKRLAGIADASTGSSSTTSSASALAQQAAQAQAAQAQQQQQQKTQQQQHVQAAPPVDLSEGRQHGSPQRPSLLLPAARAAPPLPPGPAPASAREVPAHGRAPGAGATLPGGSSRSGSADLSGLRPHRVVQRRSLDNQLLPGASPPTGGRTWADMQALLRQQTPRSRSASREGTTSSTPATRVVRLRPLE